MRFQKEYLYFENVKDFNTYHMIFYSNSFCSWSGYKKRYSYEVINKFKTSFNVQ